MSELNVTRRFKATFFFFGFAGIVLAGLLIGCLIAVLQIHRYKQESSAARQILETYRQVLGSMPEKTLAEKKAQALRLQEQGAGIAVAPERTAGGTVTPLDFKKLFFDTQAVIKANAAKKEVPFPAHLGFDEYKEKMPTERESTRLTRGLAAVSDTMLLLIDCGVRTITAVTIDPKQPENAEAQPAGSVAAPELPFSAFRFGISFETSFGGLRQFLIKLAEQQSTYIIDDISARQQNGQSGYLRVEMTLEHISL
ncbi:MAG: Amuc_1100 family pilus-like protein [Candidatus Omnitrophica bacterium]|nr:Amuc_1100 family pilus-like protein [Candidatus Omnitrophota bacterium]